jgi:hypothetical protein
VTSKNGTGRTPRPRPTVKPDFHDLCQMYNVDYDEMLAIANKAVVSIKIIQTMFVGKPVTHSDAVAVLGALSERVPESWMLSDTRIPTTPESEG